METNQNIYSLFIIIGIIIIFSIILLNVKSNKANKLGISLLVILCLLIFGFTLYFEKELMQYLSIMNNVTSYNILLCAFVLIFIMCIVLVIFNPNGFNKSVGYGLFITLIVFIIITLLLRKYSADEIDLSKSSDIIGKVANLLNSFGPAGTIGIGLALIALFIGLLSSLGLLQKNIPANNTAALFNYFIIITIIFFSYIFYNKGRKNDITLIPEAGKPFYESKIKYTAGLFLFILFVLGLYLLNPGEIMSKYGGASVFFTLFIGILMLIMIIYNDYLFNNPDKFGGKWKQENPIKAGILNLLYVLAGFTVSGLFLWALLKVMGVFGNDADNANSIRHIVVNLILLISMLGIIYKIALTGGFLQNNPYFRLVLNIILYVPCLLVVVTDFLSKLTFATKTNMNANFQQSKTDYIFLGLSVLLCSTYLFLNSVFFPFAKHQYYKVGGKTLISNPIPTNNATNVSSISELNEYGENDNDMKINYSYALSFWFYLDAMPTKNIKTNILAYGDNLHVRYYSPSNTLYVTVKETSEDSNNTNMYEIDEDNQDKTKYRIIYKKEDVLLQKWNNIVFNYSNGTLDVFYNGKLEKSAINVVPTNIESNTGKIKNSVPRNIKNKNKSKTVNWDSLIVGKKNGINGQVSNMVYFKEPIDYLTINKLYVLFKDKNPPLE